MLHSVESNFRQFAAAYLREFETEFENILGLVDLWKKTRGRKSRETVSLKSWSHKEYRETIV
jgi:predicted restriction endonuclease